MLPVFPAPGCDCLQPCPAYWRQRADEQPSELGWALPAPGDSPPAPSLCCRGPLSPGVEALGPVAVPVTAACAAGPACSRASGAHRIFCSEKFSRGLRGECRAGNSPRQEQAHLVLVLRSRFVFVSCWLVWLSIGLVCSMAFFCVLVS